MPCLLRFLLASINADRCKQTITFFLRYHTKSDTTVCGATHAMIDASCTCLTVTAGELHIKQPDDTSNNEVQLRKMACSNLVNIIISLINAFKADRICLIPRVLFEYHPGNCPVRGALWVTVNRRICILRIRAWTRQLNYHSSFSTP